MNDFKGGSLNINQAQGNSILNTYNEATLLGLTKSSGGLRATARVLRMYPTIKGEFLNMVVKNKKTFQHKLTAQAYVTLFLNFLGKEDKSGKKKK